MYVCNTYFFTPDIVILHVLTFMEVLETSAVHLTTNNVIHFEKTPMNNFT